MLRAWALSVMAAALLAAMTGARAQGTTDFGLPPPSGFQNPVLPPRSGSQNPVLPPPSGQRYLPGVGGRFGGDADLPGGGERSRRPPQRSGSGEIGVIGVIEPATKSFDGEALDRLADIAPALRRCWTPPAIEGPDAGAMATIKEYKISSQDHL